MTQRIPEWRKQAKAGVSLAAAKADAQDAASRLSSATRPSTLDPRLPDGLSKSLAKILRPQAAYRWLLPQLAAITPMYIEMVLRGAMAGNHVQAWELFDLMEDTSPRLMKNLNEVKRAVVAMDWKLWPYQEEDQPPSDRAKEKAALVSAALRTMRPCATADENDFSGTIYDVLDAWAKGQSVLEVDWESRPVGTAALGRIIAPRATYWVHPTCVAWSMTGELGLRLEIMRPQTSQTGQTGRTGRTNYTLTPGVWQSTTLQPLPSAVGQFPDHKFLISICKAKSGTALGGALLRPLAWWWCAANFSADWLLDLAQIWQLPFRWANYDPSAPQATVDAICNMLQDMGRNAWAAFPAGTTIELKESNQRAGNGPADNMLDRAEKQMDLLILGQTLTTDVSPSGGSRALGEVHAGVKREMVQAAGNFAAGILNSQLIRSILLLNYREDTEPPRFAPVPNKGEDATANATRDKTLLDAGVRMPKAWFFKRHNIPLPQEGEETVGQSTASDQSTVHSPSAAPARCDGAPARRERERGGQSTVSPSDAAQQSKQSDRGDGAQPPDKLESKTTFVHELAGENAKPPKR